MSRHASAVGLAVGLAVLSLSGAASASAVPGAAPAGNGRVLAVSVPPDPTQLGPGQTATVTVRVVNAGTRPVTVTIHGRGVQLRDNGRAVISRSEDPRWKDRIQFSTSRLTLAAQSYAPVGVTVNMPATIVPDLYFVGFVVTPVPTGADPFQVINQIGSFITVEVPGPRMRKLRASLHPKTTLEGWFNSAGVTIGDQAEATLSVRNVGPSAVRFWGETDITASPGHHAVVQKRIDKSLLPTGRLRTYQVHGAPNWPVGFVTMQSHVVYPGATETSTTEIVLERRVLVVSPWVLLVVPALLLLAFWYWRHRRRRRRAIT